MSAPTVLDVRNAIYDLLESSFGADDWDLNFDCSSREVGSILCTLPSKRPINVRIFIGNDTPADHDVMAKLHYGFDPVIYDKVAS